MDEQPTSALTTAVLYRPIFLASLGFTFLAFGLPIYSKSLGATAFAIGGLYSVFTVTTVFIRPLVGWSLDRYGRKPFLLAGFAGYVLAMTTFALASSLESLYLARIFQGMASALLWISINTIVADLSPPQERGRLMGRISETSARSEITGMFVAFFLLSILPEESTWTAIFGVFAVMTAVAVWLAYRTVPETRPQALALNRDDKPVSPRLFRLMVIVFTTGISAAMIAPIYLIYLQDKFTTDISTLAWAFLPAGLVYSLLPSRLGRLGDRWGRAPLMALGMAGAGLLSLALPRLPGLVWLIGLYTLTAVGWAMADPSEAALVADLAGTSGHGRAYGLYTFANSLGATIGPLLGGWLYDQAGQAVPFYINGFVLLFSAVWAMLALRQPRQWIKVKPDD